MPHHNYVRALPAFRPSVYTTGIQGIQPYNAGWPQGVGYGSPEYGGWFDYTPVGWAYNKVTGQDPYSADAASIKSGLSSAAQSAASGAKGLLELGIVAVQAYQQQKAAEEAERKRLEDETRTKLLINAGGFIVVALVGWVAVSRYRKNGSVFGKAVGAS